MKKRRACLAQENPHAGESLAHHFFRAFQLPSSFVIGGYWPIQSELDLRPLLYRLLEKKIQCALPCISSTPLVFRLWDLHTPLQNGLFQIPEPSLQAPLVLPHILLLPLLAFDTRGYRLGYGGGYFDQFLCHHQPLTIGVGFSGQEVPQLPIHEHDMTLDYILTEKGIYAFNDT